jgi:hypothetical protein
MNFGSNLMGDFLGVKKRKADGVDRFGYFSLAIVTVNFERNLLYSIKSSLLKSLYVEN